MWADIKDTLKKMEVQSGDLILLYSRSKIGKPLLVIYNKKTFHAIVGSDVLDPTFEDKFYLLSDIRGLAKIDIEDLLKESYYDYLFKNRDRWVPIKNIIRRNPPKYLTHSQPKIRAIAKECLYEKT